MDILSGYMQIGSKNGANQTPMQIALEDKNLDMSYLLLNKGADSNTVDSMGENILFLALRQESDKFFQIIDLWSIDLEHKNKKQQTLIQLSISENKFQIFKTLIQKQCNIKTLDVNGRQPIHNTAIGGLIEFLDLLLECEVGINTQSGEGLTPLHYAIDNNQVICAMHILEKGGDFNMLTEKGDNALHLCCTRNNEKVFNAIVDKVNIDLKNKEGITALMMACNYEYFPLVKSLVEKHANVNLFDERNRTPLFFSIKKKSLTIADYLLSHGADLEQKSNG